MASCGAMRTVPAMRLFVSVLLSCLRCPPISLADDVFQCCLERRELVHKPTSMIGLCQEGKSSPDALRRSACTKLFLIPRRVRWPLSRGSFFQIRTRLPFAVSAFQLHRRLSLCFLPVSKLINEGIQSLRSFAQSA